jgi:outer membrane protein insertion porin family
VTLPDDLDSPDPDPAPAPALPPLPDLTDPTPPAPDLSALATPAEGPVVREIEVRYLGPQTIDRAAVLSNMSTKVGDRFSEDKARNDIGSLFATGDAENVRILRQDVPGGTKVIVEITTRGAVGDVSFVGNESISDDRLRREVELAIGDPLDEIALQSYRAAIEQLYRDRGFPDASVAYRTDPMREGFSRITYTVNEGVKVVVNDISFEGNYAFSDRQLRSQMQVKEKSLWSFLTKSGRIDPEALEDDYSRIERFYQDSGYLNARVVDVQRVPRDRGNKVDLILTIEEGDQFMVSAVQLRGTQEFSEAEILPLLQSASGMPYSISKIDEDERAMRNFYGARGFADARVATTLEQAGDTGVNIIYTVEEGTLSYIRRIDIGGNIVTRDRVIRRELAVAPGDEFNTVRLEASQQRLRNLGYFSNVDISQRPTPMEGYKDIVVNVAEQSTGTINFGAGFSSIDNLVGFIDLTQSNFDLFKWPSFRGAGQKFRLGVKAGSERRDFIMSLTEPWFMGRQLSLGGDLFYRDRFFLSDVYDQTDYGMAFRLRKPLGTNSYMGLEYTIQQVEIDVDDGGRVSDAIRSEEGEFLQSRLEFSIVNDTRDSFFIPRTGHLLRGAVAASGGILGGDVETYGFSFGAQQHFNLPLDTILSFIGEFTTVDSIGDSDTVPIFERTFLGGANDLRGFKYREVSPKDQFGEPLGGKSSAYVTVEYTFPVIQRIRGAVFYDVGTVSTSFADLGGDVNSDYGFGVRLFILPGGAPIRLDYGIPLQSDEFNDSSGRFNFNIGYQF